MTLEGLWNASTNSPSLSDSTGDPGMTYIVSTTATRNLGSGNQTFVVDDLLVYTNGGIWKKVSGGGGGNVGETIVGVNSAGTTMTTATPMDITSVTLTAGDWMLTSQSAINNGAQVMSNSLSGISTTSGATLGLSLGDGYTQFITSTANQDTVPFSNHLSVSISVTTTYYLKGQAVFSSGTTKGYGKLTAVRLK
jgi:hypothetical protein